MPENIFTLNSMPGVRRDGTTLSSPFYTDGVWVRFQNGKPRKIGGYSAVTQQLNGPVRHVHVDSRSGVNSLHYFSASGIQRQDFDSGGGATSVYNRTPFGFAADARLNWSSAAMYSSTGGAYTALIAASAPDVLDIASDTAGYVYSGDITGSAPLVSVADGSGPISVSGGCCVLQPFLFVYGSNGLIKNSKANDFSSSGWSGGDANAANVCGTKIVYGAPLRGGSASPAGLFWALDTLIRVSYNRDATTKWSYDTVSNPTSVLSKKAIVEHDGMFFWPAVDRFLVYNGVVKELPNIMSSDWFFDNLNWDYRNKVWGTKIARYGEIWWFYPRGTDTECGNAIIFNYLENTWYDAVLQRTAGASALAYPRPMWAGLEDTAETVQIDVGVRIQLNATTVAPSKVCNTSSTTNVAVGQVVTGASGVATGSKVASLVPNTSVTLDLATTANIPNGTVLSLSGAGNFTMGETVTGGTSGATGTLFRLTPLDMNISQVTGTFVLNETITGSTSAATAKALSAPVETMLYTAYQHEYGWDKVVAQDLTAIPSSFTTREFGFAVGAPVGEAPKTVNVMTRLERYEPDFLQIGPLTVTIEGRSFADESASTLYSEEMPVGEAFLNPRAQDRILRVKVESNVAGGMYEAGQVQVHLTPGDGRSTKATP